MNPGKVELMESLSSAGNRVLWLERSRVVRMKAVILPTIKASYLWWTLVLALSTSKGLHAATETIPACWNASELTWFHRVFGWPGGDGCKIASEQRVRDKK